MASENLTTSKSWRTLRREIGEKRAATTAEDTQGASSDFFDVKRPRMKYPQELEKPTKPIQYKYDDPYAHLGKIGYTRNTYQFRGPGKNDNNIYASQHMKKTLWLEEMRRRIIAEQVGISAEVDETSIGGTADAYYLDPVKSREKRNKYLKRASVVPHSWTTTPSATTNNNRNPTSSSKTSKA